MSTPRIAGYVNIPLELSPAEAWALAQMCKRFTFEDAKRLAAAHDGDKERDTMLDAIRLLQTELSNAGYNPR